MLTKKIRFYSMHHFTISTFEIVPQLNDNIRTRVNKSKGYQEIRTVKTFEFKNKRRRHKMGQIIKEWIK